MTIDWKGGMEMKIQNRNIQGRKTIPLLNGALLDRTITKRRSNIFTVMLSIKLSCGSKVQSTAEAQEMKLLATEMDF